MATNDVQETNHYPTVIVGAGPAGLTAAYELSRLSMPLVVLEQSDKVGGLARTEAYKGYRFDVGGHRFFTKIAEVEALWHEVLGNDFIEVRRLSRIYYEEKFYLYPLNLRDTFSKLGLAASLRILLSYLKAQIIPPYAEEENFEQWVSNRFGVQLYKTFFKTYTEKVWGIPCDRINADWAAQRIKDLSLKSVLFNALFKTGSQTTLINKFNYPILGPGLMWERFCEHIKERGGMVRLNTEVIRLSHQTQHIECLLARHGETTHRITGDQFISSMPITELVARLDPKPPARVIEGAKNLSHRALIVVVLIVDNADVFPDNWIYIHSPKVKVGRIQNFKNWSSAMVPDEEKSCLGMEYFCTEGDGLWMMSDEELMTVAQGDLATIKLASEDEVIDGTVIRERMAYPVYDRSFKKHLVEVRGYLAQLENFQTIGRGGMHRYNNQDHSMLTALLAVKNILGEKHDLWSVNVERSYHESYS